MQAGKLHGEWNLLQYCGCVNMSSSSSLSESPPVIGWNSFRALKTFVSRIKIVCSALQIRSALGYAPFAKQMPSFAKHSPCFALPCVSTANQFLSRSKNMVSRIKIVCCALRIRSALEYISTAIETSSFAKQKHSSAKHSPSFAPQYFLSRNN